MNQDVFFAIPFTFGTAFDHGLYAYANSSDGSTGPSFADTGQSLFQNTIALDGIDEVLAGPGETLAAQYAEQPAADGEQSPSRRASKDKTLA